jgi:hypothetical protein
MDSSIVLASQREGGGMCAIKRLIRISKSTIEAVLTHSRILHPHVLRVKEVLEDFTGLLVVTEYAHVGELQTYLSTKPNGCLSEPEAR